MQRSSAWPSRSTVLLPQKGYPADVDLTPESLRNLGYPIDWDGLLDYVGRPAILKPYSGGGWKHVYKVDDREELLAAYDAHLAVLHDAAAVHRLSTSTCAASRSARPTSSPVAYDPHERRYLVEHEYLTAELGARVVRDAQTHQPRARLRDEHDRVRDRGRRAVRDRLPQPGARLRTRPHHAVLLRHRRREDGASRHRSRAERRSAQSWPRWEEMLGIGHGVRLRRRAAPRSRSRS